MTSTVAVIGILFANLKSSFDLELEVQELAGEHLVLDNAANVGMNGPLRRLEAGCSLAVAPPGIGHQSLHMTETRVTTAGTIDVLQSLLQLTSLL